MIRRARNVLLAVIASMSSCAIAAPACIDKGGIGGTGRATSNGGLGGSGAPARGIGGTGAPASGIGGTGSPVASGIGGTGAPAHGIGGTGSPVASGIGGTGAPASGIGGTGAPVASGSVSCCGCSHARFTSAEVDGIVAHLRARFLEQP